MPPSVVKEAGSRWRTTLFAAPPSFCQTRGAASFLSESLRLASYHLHEVANPSNPAGSPSQVGTSSEGIAFPTKAAASSHSAHVVLGHQVDPSGSAYHESRPIQRTKPARCGAKPHRAALSSGRARAPTLRAKRGMFMNRVIAFRNSLGKDKGMQQPLLRI